MSDLYKKKAKKYKYKYLILKKEYIGEGGAGEDFMKGHVQYHVQQQPGPIQYQVRQQPGPIQYQVRQQQPVQYHVQQQPVQQQPVQYPVKHHVKANEYCNVETLLMLMREHTDYNKQTEIKNKWLSKCGFLPAHPPYIDPMQYKKDCQSKSHINLNQLDIKQIYPNYILWNSIDPTKFVNGEYIYELQFNEEGDITLKNFKKQIKKFDPESKYTSEIVYVGRIDHNSNNKQQDNISTLVEKLPLCQVSNSTSSGNKYIIRKNIGKSFLELTEDDINVINIKDILISLREGIINFITKIYKKHHIIDNINLHNMSLKDNKVYYNIDNILKNKTKYFKIKQNYDQIFHHPILICLHDLYINNNEKQNFNIKFIKDYLDKNYKNFVNGNKLLENEIEKLFKDFKDFNEDKELNIFDIIVYFAKNTDIYALTVLIKQIFNNFISKDINKPANLLINKLRVDARYNTIKDPSDLSKRLDEIIESIKFFI
jgi:hypothetical protein